MADPTLLTAASMTAAPDDLTFLQSDPVLSRGLTIRDPDTGVLYVQTQLLQVMLELHGDNVN